MKIAALTPTSFAFGVLLATSSLAASAATMTSFSSLGNDVYLNAGTTGTFDINSLLTPPGTYNAPYQISSATVNFLFQDDANDPTVSSHYTTAYTPAAITSRLDVTRYSDPVESASVMVGGQSMEGQTTYYAIDSHLDHVTTDWSYYANNCPGYTGACNHQLFQGSTHYYTSTSGYGGNFGISYTLDGSNLADLAADGLLSFSLGVSGDLMLQSASLIFDITAAAPGSNTTPSVSAVPEPETGALLLAGLGMMGVVARRRKAVQA